MRELRPAHLLQARGGSPKLDERRYWKLPVPHAGEHRRVSRRDAEEELLSLLRLRVYDHLISDVPVGAYLSGGVDSSAICSLIRDVTGDPPVTFSIAFSSEAFDESAFAQRMVQHLGAPNHTVTCDDTTPHELPSMLWHTELPLQFPLALPLQRLSALASARGCPVVLTGEGADELLGGYDAFRADKMRRLFDRPGMRFLRAPVYRQLYKWHGLPEGAVDSMLDNQAKSGLVTQRFGMLPPWYDIWTCVGLDRERLLAPDGRTVRPTDEPPEGWSELLPDDLEHLHPMDAGLALEQTTRLPAWILLIGDRASMASSVEARVPLLDHEVAEFMAALPPSYKMRGFTEKALLRGAVADLLPREIARRRKRPFYTPVREWFFGPGAPDFVGEMLSERAIADAGLFDAALVQQYRDEMRTAPANHLQTVRLEWTLLQVLGTQLLHHYFVRERCRSAPGISAAA